MERKTLQQLRKRLLILYVIGALLGSSFLLSSTNAQGTSTNFQGPKAKFYGIEYQPDGIIVPLHYSFWDRHSGVSMADFGTTLKFDADGRDSGKANIYGEMTSIYLPSNTLGNINPWLPTSWLNQLQYVENPLGNYTWQIGEKHYGMERWLCRFYIAFSAEWEGGIRDLPYFGGGYGEAPPQPCYYDGDNSYRDLEVWLEIDMRPTFYYANAERTYFALGKIQLSNPVKYQGTTLQQGSLFSSNLVEPRSTVSVLPESTASLLYLYDQPWGDAGSPRETQYSYQGQPLSADVFKEKHYIKLDFNKFGVYGGTAVWGVPAGFWCKGDVAVICFDVTVFSIGQWQVQDVQDDPDNYGRFVRTDQSGDFLGWLLHPSTLAWLLPLAVFLLLLFFAPWVLLALISILQAIFGGRRR